MPYFLCVLAGIILSLIWWHIMNRARAREAYERVLDRILVGDPPKLPTEFSLEDWQNLQELEIRLSKGLITEEWEHKKVLKLVSALKQRAWLCMQS